MLVNITAIRKNPGANNHLNDHERLFPLAHARHQWKIKSS